MINSIINTNNTSKIEYGVFDSIKSEIINSTLTRLKDINFTMGGHHYVYPELIPEDTIFIDDRMNKDNVIATLIHEYVERLFMKFYGLKYNDAHNLSNEIEIIIRKFMYHNLQFLEKDFIKGR